MKYFFNTSLTIIFAFSWYLFILTIIQYSRFQESFLSNIIRFPVPEKTVNLLLFNILLALLIMTLLKLKWRVEYSDSFDSAPVALWVVVFYLFFTGIFSQYFVAPQLHL